MNPLKNGATLHCAKCGDEKSWSKFRPLKTASMTGEINFADECRQCEDPLDCDLYEMDKWQLIDEAKKLRAGVRNHRDANGHDLCWFHPELWSLLPEKVGPNPEPPPWSEFMQQCAAYRATLDKRRLPLFRHPPEGDVADKPFAPPKTELQP